MLPRARRELRGWARRAQAIPDPALRRHACATLREEDANAEGAALFALAAPREAQPAVVRLLVVAQVLYDYLDTLSEQPAPDPLAASRRLHGALRAALGKAAATTGDWYAGYAWGDDGGYLAALVATCRERLAALPARAVVAAGLERAAARASESQSRNHAAMLGALDGDALAAWAAALPAGGAPLRWWELAAAAGSSLGLHALATAAANPWLTPADAARLEAAYWPWGCALNTLLESVVDGPADARSGNHSYVGRYATRADAAARLAMIAARAAAAVRALPDGAQHAAVLAAMASFYLEAPREPADAALRDGVLAQLRLDTRHVRRALRLRRFG
ncbi:MAG TPA: DUF2600 family protein [Conexibacter sp.]|nr:DUF2600 family protein [Conexibacter sp.]